MSAPNEFITPPSSPRPNTSPPLIPRIIYMSQGQTHLNMDVWSSQAIETPTRVQALDVNELTSIRNEWEHDQLQWISENSQLEIGSTEELEDAAEQRLRQIFHDVAERQEQTEDATLTALIAASRALRESPLSEFGSVLDDDEEPEVDMDEI